VHLAGDTRYQAVLDAEIKGTVVELAPALP
jgi:hypothetical protein